MEEYEGRGGHGTCIVGIGRSKWTQDVESMDENVVSRADARAWALQRIMSAARDCLGLVSMVSDMGAVLA